MTTTSSSSSSRGAFLSPAAPVFQPGSGMHSSSGQGDMTSTSQLLSRSSSISDSPHKAAEGAAPPPSRLGLNPNAAPFHQHHTTSLQQQQQQQQQKVTSLAIPMLYSPASLSHSPVSPMSSGPHSPYSVSPGATTPSFTPNGNGGLLGSSPNHLAQAASRWASAVSNHHHSATDVRMDRRGSKGLGAAAPPIHQPFKMMHHNSKPSVSLNPAALSSLLAAAAKPKRKTIVRLPDLSGYTGDVRAISEEAEEGEGDAAAAEDPAQERRRKLRLQWTTQWPSGEEEGGVDRGFASPQVPQESIRSYEALSDPDAPLEGLPDFIDICLPTKDGWEELKAFFQRERLEYEEEENGSCDARSSSGESSSSSCRAERNGIGQTPTKRCLSHAPVMSLSMPSSGQPFGPSALTALGLHRMNRSQSDRGGESTAMLDKRPSLDRVKTDGFTTIKEQQNGRSLEKTNAWRELGHGFGYDVSEAATESGGDGKGEEKEKNDSGSDSKEGDTSKGDSAGQGGLREEGNGDWRAQRRRVSGTGSDDDGDDEERRRRGQQDIREDEDEGNEETETESASEEEEEYSNPSDEEEARRVRMQEQRRRAAKREAREDELLAVEETGQNRPRSGTADTFASSSIAPEETNLPRRYSLLARGPLDDFAPALSRSTSLRGSQMHPDAPPFAPRGMSHSHLPSIPMSNFSNDTVRSRGSSLNAAAPTFTPGAFTFTAPRQAPRLPSLPNDPALEGGRDLQGREKRQRQRDVALDGPESPARPHGSTANVERLLRQGAAAVPYGTSAGAKERSRHMFDVAGDHSGSSTPSITEGETENDETVKEDGRMDRTLSNRSNAVGGRSSLAATMLQSARSSSANLKREMSLLSQQRRRSSGNELDKFGDGKPIEGNNSDSGSVSDIIEELVERMDEALEGWAGRILDEMMIIGQVRPVTMGVLDQREKQSIAEAVRDEIKGVLVEQMSQLGGREGAARPAERTGEALARAAVRQEAALDLAPIKEMISALHRDQAEAMEAALVRTLQSASREGGGRSSEDVEAIASAVRQHLQDMQDDSVQLEKSKLIDILDPMLEEYQSRSQAKAQAERREVIHSLDEMFDRRLAEWQQGLVDIKQSLGEEKERGGRARGASAGEEGDRNLVDRMTLETVTQTVLQLVEKHRLEQEAGRGEREKDGTDMDAVVALLQPLVAKQEESRMTARKLLESQGEMESTLEMLPSAVSAKLDIFLSTTRTIEEAHQAIVAKLESLQGVGARGEEQEVTDGSRQVGASSQQISTLQDECTRLRGRLEEAEKDARLMRDQLEGSRRAEEEARHGSHAATEKLIEAEANAREKEFMLTNSQEQTQLLRNHIDQMAAEVTNSREERGRERETSAQAIAEALDKRKAAEAHLTQERQKVEEARVRGQQVAEEARERGERYAERASKAEGQVSTLEKRVAEQDTKIANLQQLTATQKQKAAQAGQKLAEVEKRAKELNGKDRELMVARTRLAEMESRLQDQKELEQRWRASQESEAKLREEVAMHRARFLDLERDVLQMRETLVDRSSLEQTQADLSSSREEVALLRGQLAESQRKEESARLLQVGGGPPPSVKRPLKVKRVSRGNRDDLSWGDNDHNNNNQSMTHGSNTWASVRGPDSSIDDSYESVGHAASRSISRMSSSRVVEVNDDGWWE